MNKTVLGLKIGITAVAYNLVRKENGTINNLRTGMHVFSSPEDPKTKESFKALRSERARNQLRLKRTKRRLKKIKRILDGFISRNHLPPISPGDASNLNRWKCRAEALFSHILPYDLYLVLYHMGKFRGYFSHEKKDNQDKSGLTGQVNVALQKNEEELIQQPSFAHVLLNRPTFRNKRGDYTNIARREWLRADFKNIIRAQKQFYDTKKLNFFTDNEINELESLMFDQNFLKNKLDEIYPCVILPENLRLSRSHPLADEFLFLTKLLSADWVNLQTKEKFKLDSELLSKCYKKYLEKGSFTVSNFKKILGMNAKDKLFNSVIKVTQIHESPLIADYKKLEDEIFSELSADTKENIFKYLSFVYDPVEKKSLLESLNLPDDHIAKLLELTTLPGTLKFSREVVEVLLPYMRKGLTNSEALEHARFHKLLPDDCLPQPKDLLPPFPELPSQVINRPAGITRKIVNALIREHGKIDEIHLEIGSELGKTVDARRKLIKLQKNAFQLNAQAIEFLESNHLKFTSENLLVYRLWKSQNEKDILTNERITIQDISDGNAIELVINPRSFTRTFMNKLLILRKNLHNVNELMATIVDNYAINSELYPYIPDPKIENMQCRLNNGSTGEVAFIPRQAWLLKHILNHISANLKDVSVIAFPKPMVKFIKNTELFWLDEVTTQPSFKQKNINIIDAMILAKLDKSHIHALEKHLENPFDSHFRLNLNLSKDTVCDFLSTFRPTLQPNRRLKGEAHLQTNFKVIDPKLRNLPSGERIVFPKDRMAIRNDPIKTFLLKRIPLQSISKANFDYIQNFETTPFLKEKLLKRLEKFDWNAEKAFQKPIEIPIYKKIKGARNEVKKVRMFTNKIYSVYIYEEARSVVAMKGGAVKYGDQVALNIYKYNSRYWGSPIYAMDILALRSKKARGEDTTFPKTFINGAGEYPLEPNAKFVCRLHYGDFVTFKTPDVLIDSNGGSTYKLISGYYGGYNRSTNTIQIINGLENEYFIQKGGIGIEELQKSTLLDPISTVAILKMETIVKKHVNILGDIRDCVSEEIPLV